MSEWIDRLLQSWEDKGDSQQHLETWEFIEQTIDSPRRGYANEYDTIPTAKRINSPSQTRW
jgi:hypothetical protein